MIRAIILNTINLDLMTIKNYLRGDLKNMFCHFSKRRWTFEIILLVKASDLCVLHPIWVGGMIF